MRRTALRLRLRPLWPGLLLAISSAFALPVAATPSTKPVVDGAVDNAGLRLHVPSPEWREQIVYFAMIDRFDDGDAGNNEQGQGEFDPGSNAKYSGGDLRGLSRRLDYLHDLGATALWITPPVAHRWWHQGARYGGYHGYWGEHFAEVDRHFGDLDDYRQLSHALHSRGMYLIQDIVVNHTADYFRYDAGYRAGDPAAGYQPVPDPAGRTAPRQWPFSLNDARDPAQRGADIYHWTPDIADYSDPRQERDGQMAGLDDLNTENPQVRRALRSSYGHWIRAVGVDGFRVDTAFYVAPDYFEDFLYADDRHAPGVLAVAAATGRQNFHVFGEGFGIDHAGEDRQMRKIDSYMRGPDGQPRMPGMLDFPLYGSAQAVFARGHATSELAERLRLRQTLHADPGLLPTFVDNHDVDRFLAGGSRAALQQNLLLILTVPGIPTIYYGTEQGFREPRAAMFAGGFGAGGRDHFDQEAPLYRYLQRAIALRRAHPVFAHGRVTPLRDNPAGPGALVYRVDHAGASALVAFNTADHPLLVDALDIGRPGARLRGRFAIDAAAGDLHADAEARLDLILPARAGLVWQMEAEAQSAGTSHVDAEDRLGVAPTSALPRPHIDPPPSDESATPFLLAGQHAGLADLQLVIDGDLLHARPIEQVDAQRWQATVATDDLLDPAVDHRAVLWSAACACASNAVRFRVRRPWLPAVSVDDPAGDDHGPRGDYRYPTDASWQGRHPLDLRRVAVATRGGGLQLDIGMAELLADWNPAHGFDHLALTVFIELPGVAGGVRVMPLQNTELPDGLRWHRRLRVHGWSNALFTADGASPSDEGRALSPGARIVVDRAASRIRLQLPAAALGQLASLSGARLWITTWDYDGGYKALQPQADAHRFGGGDGQRDPLWMDASAVIVLP